MADRREDRSLKGNPDTISDDRCCPRHHYLAALDMARHRVVCVLDCEAMSRRLTFFVMLWIIQVEANAIVWVLVLS